MAVVVIRWSIMNGRLHRTTALWRRFPAFCLLASACCLPSRAAPERPSARAYLYLEPESARFECLVPLPEMMRLLGQPPGTSLTAEAQQSLRDAAARKAAGWLRLLVDGSASPVGATFRATVVKGVPGRTELLSPGESVSAGEAMLGLVWEYDLAAVPEKLTFTWTEFNGTLPSLAVSIIIGSRSEDHELSGGAPSFEWINGGRLASHSPLAAVPPLPPVETIRLPLGSILWAVFGMIFLIRQLRPGRRVPGRLMITLMSILLGAAVLWPVASWHIKTPWSAVVPVSSDQAERILTPLLRNVYRAFDGRQEREIYDVLERSIEGDLLERIYLQTVNALTLDALDSTRARVTDLDVRVDSVRMASGRRGFVADAQWTALGTVGHWGHLHQRINRYIAKVTVAAVPVGNGKTGEASAWKIVGLEVEQETRM